MAQKICILSYNCRGLNNDSNRKKLFLWLQEQKLDIIMLQETFCTDKLEPFLKNEWKGQIFLGNTDSSHSRGVAVLFKDNFDGTVLNTYTSNDGRIVIVNIQLYDEIISVCSIYAPSIETERINFFGNLTTTLRTHCMNIENIIFAGDLNTCLRDIDRLPNLGRHDRSSRILVDLIKTCKLNDLWVSHHAQAPGFTYYDKKNSK